MKADFILKNDSQIEDIITMDKDSRKLEVYGEILGKESNDKECINTSSYKAQEENVIKEEKVPLIEENEIEYEFIDEIVKEEPEDNHEVIDLKSELNHDSNDEFHDETSSNAVLTSISTIKKPHKCSECHKSFRSSTKLRIHIRVHTGEKPYKCNVCNRMFSQKSSVNTHMRTHTGEKLFKCNICEKTFMWKGSFVCHKYTHSDIKKIIYKKFKLRTH